MFQLRQKVVQRSDPLIVLAPILAILLALALGGVLLLLLGRDPILAYRAMWDGAIGNPFENHTSLANTFTRAIPLMLVATGICVAFRGGVINIGSEGQLFVGALAVVALSASVGDSLPALVYVPLSLVVGFAGGALWGGIPGFLRTRFSVNEILCTIMMNQIAIQLLNIMLSGPLRDPSANVTQSARLPEAVWLGRMLPPTRLHTGIFVALIATVVTWLLLWRTPIGYRIRAVGQNREASRYAGISVPVYIVLALALSGGLAGLGGAVELTGVSRRMVSGFAAGYGFSGIVVAIFGRLHPLGAIPSALLFSAMVTGAERMQRTVQVHYETIIAIQGIVVLFAVCSSMWVQRRASRRLAIDVSMSRGDDRPAGGAGDARPAEA